MPSTQVTLILAAVWVVFMTTMASVLVKAVVNSTWMTIARAHPGVDPAPDAVRRTFQSFKMNMLNLGLSVHVAVDDAYLHLFPSRFLRWFGAPQASVPWNAVQDLGPGLMGRHKVKIEGIVIWGPQWCLKLAAEE